MSMLPRLRRSSSSTFGTIADKRVSTPTRLDQEQSLMYADSPRASALLRTNPAHPMAGSGDFAADLAQLARRLRLSVPALSPAEIHALKDVADNRYPMKMLCMMMRISSRSVRADDREALPELVRRECLVGVPSVLDARLVGRLETQAQGPHDVAWGDFEWSPSRTTCERAHETARVHFAGLRAQLDTLSAFRRTL
jgi:hypothetical protein